MFKRFRRFRLATLLGFITCVAIGMAIYHSLTQQALRGHATPEAAATAMIRAISTKNHKLFVRTRLLGVCEGQNDWPSRYAESLHTTKFSNPSGAMTVFDMRRRLMADTVRVVSMNKMNVPSWFGASSYYGERFASVDVSIANYDGVEYRSRIVVAEVSDQWFAVPRRGRCPVYNLADTLPAATDS